MAKTKSLVALLLLALSTPALADLPTVSLNPSDFPGQPNAKTLLLGTPTTTDYAARLTLYWENDGGFAKPNNRTDRHYTAGAGAALSWQAPWVNSLISAVPSINNEFDPQNADYAMGIVGSLSIYTPQDIAASAPIHNDRPYAGYSYAGVFFQRANRFPTNNLPPVWESLEFDVGIMGPSSLAENAQEMVHNYYHYQLPNGWDNQIHDEPEFSIKYNRRWRIDAWTPEDAMKPWMPSLQILPEIGFTAGSIFDEVHIGSTFRLGWNMPDDFGPGLLAMPNDFTWKSPRTSGKFDLETFFADQSFTLFARPYGRAVAYNATFTGDDFRHDDPITVQPNPGVVGVQVGFTHRIGKFFELTYSQSYETPEFRGQRGGDAFGSIQLAFFLAF